MANALPHPNLFATFPCVTMDFVRGGGVDPTVPGEVGNGI